MPNHKMPFLSVPCSIWLRHVTGTDSYNNEVAGYAEEPDIQTTCVYAPGGSKPDTAADLEDGRPTGARVAMTFFLPKTVTADLRGALISCSPADDPALSARRFSVLGKPYSYPRASVPGDYSWCVEAVEYLG